MPHHLHCVQSGLLAVHHHEVWQEDGLLLGHMVAGADPPVPALSGQGPVASLRLQHPGRRGCGCSLSVAMVSKAEVKCVPESLRFFNCLVHSKGRVGVYHLL